MRTTLLCVAGVALVAAPLHTQDTKTSVSATIAGTRSHASDLTQAALIGRGWTITSATDNLIVTEQRYVRTIGYPISVRVSLVAVGSDSARAIMTGQFPPMDYPGSLPIPVTTSHKPEYRELQAIRDAVVATSKRSS